MGKSRKIRDGQELDEELATTDFSVLSTDEQVLPENVPYEMDAVSTIAEDEEDEELDDAEHVVHRAETAQSLAPSILEAVRIDIEDEEVYVKPILEQANMDKRLVSALDMQQGNLDALLDSIMGVDESIVPVKKKGIKSRFKAIVNTLKGILPSNKPAQPITISAPLGTPSQAPNQTDTFLKQYQITIKTTSRLYTYTVYFTDSPAVLASFFVHFCGRVIGLDTETAAPHYRMTYRSASLIPSAPDLIQLASPKHVLLFKFTHVTAQPTSADQTKRDMIRIKNTERVLRCLFRTGVFWAGMNIDNDVVRLKSSLKLDVQRDHILELARSTKRLLRKVLPEDYLMDEPTAKLSKRAQAWMDEARLFDRNLHRFMAHDGLGDLSALLLHVHLPKEQHSRRRRGSKSLFSVTEFHRDASRPSSPHAPLPLHHQNQLEDDQSDTASIRSDWSASSQMPRRTDWNNPNLDELQVAYASLDAWASLMCWNRLEEIYQLWKHQRVKGKSKRSIQGRESAASERNTAELLSFLHASELDVRVGSSSRRSSISKIQNQPTISETRSSVMS